MCLTIGGALFLSSAAHAEPTKEDIKRADELFREGRAMMAAGKLPEACVKIEESAKLAGGIGTLINLGACYERSGKLAIAYGVYSRAAAVAREAGRLDREKEASDRASSLFALIGRVRVTSRPGEDVTLACNGTATPALERSLFALDIGPHHCDVRVAGTLRWSGLLKLIAGETQTIDIPPSGGPAPPPTPPPVREPARPPPPPPPPPPVAPDAPPSEGASARVVVGWSLVGVGVAALGVSGLFALSATSKDNDANAHCDARGCDARGVALGDEAKSAGNVATGFVIGGGAALAGGLVLVLLLRPSSSAAASSNARIVPFVASGTGGVGVSGRF